MVVGLPSPVTYVYMEFYILHFFLCLICMIVPLQDGSAISRQAVSCQLTQDFFNG
jgi:hypothetical protein